MSVPKTAKASRSVRIGAALMATVALAGTAAAATMAASAPPNGSLTVPVPTGVIQSPDAACASVKTPKPSFCQNGARYVVKVSMQAAHTMWVPPLATWGLRTTRDTCVAVSLKPAVVSTQAGAFCVIQGTRVINKVTNKVTVLFKTQYDLQYSPAVVKAQTDLIQKQASKAALLARTPAAKSTILKNADLQAAAVVARAAAWNAAHPRTVVNVAVTK